MINNQASKMFVLHFYLLVIEIYLIIGNWLLVILKARMTNEENRNTNRWC